MGQNLYLHGFRGLLAFLLLVFHVANSGLPTFTGQFYEPVHFLLLSFEHGVELFFGISGIVILSAFGKSKTIYSFMLNRATRILPVLWVCISVIIFLSFFQSDKKIDLDVMVVIANLLCLPPAVPVQMIHPASWTLCYEFMFYSLFILLAIPNTVLGKNLRIWILGALAIFLLMVFPRSWCFLAGVIVFRYVHPEKCTSRIFDYSGIFIFLSFLIWHQINEYLNVHGFNSSSAFINYMSVEYTVWLQFLAFAFAFLGLAGVFLGRGLLSKFLLTKPMQFLGTISYSLYLWQTITMAIVKFVMKKLGIVEHTAEWSQLVFFILVVPPTLIVSYISQRLIEDKLTNALRHRFKIKPHQSMPDMTQDHPAK